MTTLNEVISTLSDKTRGTILCADGLELSVQASESHHCLDARGLNRHECWDNEGRCYDQRLPFSAVEVGLFHPSPEVPHEWSQYQEELGPDSNIDVYNFVPAHMVRELIEAHGGEG